MSDGLSLPGRNRLLAALSPPDLSLLRPHLNVLPTRLGDVIQREGEAIEHVHFPVVGMVSLLACMKDGWAVETVTVGREGAVGTAAGLGKRIAPTRATIQAAGRLLQIAAAHFRQTAGQSEGIRSLILDNAETMLSQSQQTTACSTIHTLPERLARWLLQTQDRVESDTLPLTQEFLSQMLGVRRTSVTLVAKQLQQAGAIQTLRGRVKVIDRSKLRAIACECYEIIRKQGSG